MRMVGRARDAATAAGGGEPVVLAEDGFRAQVGWDRTIVAIEAEPGRAAMARLVGLRGGGHLRAALDDVMPEEQAGATPLHIILDDLSGASLVAGWAWTRWTDGWLAARRRAPGADGPALPNMEGVCFGFRPGSSSLAADGAPAPSQSAARVGDLRRPEDPHGWHAYDEQVGVGMRRARRIDVWLDDLIRVDSAFQDSATDPAGGRVAVHEYALRAAVDPESLTIVSLEAEPRVLPYRECPGAVANVARLIGAPLAGLRLRVLRDLKGTAGCTHLNDALRALAEVGVLVERLGSSR